MFERRARDLKTSRLVRRTTVRHDLLSVRRIGVIALTSLTGWKRWFSIHSEVVRPVIDVDGRSGIASWLSRGRLRQ
jgi:hypothetical protein